MRHIANKRKIGVKRNCGVCATSYLVGVANFVLVRLIFGLLPILCPGRRGYRCNMNVSKAVHHLSGNSLAHSCVSICVSFPRTLSNQKSNEEKNISCSYIEICWLNFRGAGAFDLIMVFDNMVAGSTRFYCTTKIKKIKTSKYEALCCFVWSFALASLGAGESCEPQLHPHPRVVYFVLLGKRIV